MRIATCCRNGASVLLFRNISQCQAAALHAGLATGVYSRDGERTDVDVTLLSSLAATPPTHESMMHREGVLPPLLEDTAAEGAYFSGSHL